AENKVDFRALLKELGTTYKTRVELRQIGARDVTKLIGGLGRCGRPICCSTHLSKFDPISVRMARDQSLTLNPAMISGICGKLLCCLKYEHGQYLDAKKSKPAPETKKAIIEPEDSNGDDLNGAAAILESEPIKAIEITTEVQTEENPPKEKPKIFRRKRRRRKKGGSPGNDRK
ncbi:MAG: regulatory iron-sulfur-containing complex subunit RicT, partial [Chloroflexota bacterium]|nr:regulatory iron-sulfur-containing complex subunit RicT [Chloroflexota bacterium]